jgi:hypothetical protein
MAVPDIRIWEFFVLSMVVLWAGILAGSWIHAIRPEVVENENKIISVLEGALLTLFGLLMGFTFSMAVSRYDTRKLLAVQEANAIGTTWLRTATLAEPVRTEEQNLLREYVQQRILFHKEFRGRGDVRETVEHAATLQERLWAAASNYATDHREAVTGLYLAALNNAIDTAAERDAADENRIPAEAWWMLLFVGFVANVVMGTKISPRRWLLQSILPVVLAATLAMTLDLDSPRFGLIRVTQIDMERLAQEMTRLPQQAP